MTTEETLARLLAAGVEVSPSTSDPLALAFIWPLNPAADAAFVAAQHAEYRTDPERYEAWMDGAVVEHLRTTEGR